MKKPTRAASLACALWIAGTAAAAAYDLQGHRGARGLAPENTLAGFRLALELGVTTLETDLAVTRDDVLVLAHDPSLNPDLVRGPDGRWITPPGPAIRSLTLAELKRYDVGRLDPASRYAQQLGAQKPRDGERIPTLAELYAMAGPAVRFNIETKLDPARPDGTVAPDHFTRLTVEAIRAARAEARTTIQSFDWRTLLIARKLAPEIDTGCLTIESATFDTVRRHGGAPSPWLGGLDLSQHGGSLPQLVKAAGCGTWSPFWRNVTAETVAEAKGLGLKVVPWTVNSPADMARLLALGVDGLITDYPDRAPKPR